MGDSRSKEGRCTEAKKRRYRRTQRVEQRMGRRSWRDRWAHLGHRERQADTQRDSQPNEAGGQRRTENPGLPRPSGHPEMEQEAVGGMRLN